MIIYGKHAVIAALSNQNRKHKKLFVTELVRQKLNLKTPNNCLIETTTNQYLDKLVQNTSHQGIALETSPIFQTNLVEFYKKLEQKTSHILILDHLEDPQNIGNIIRSAAAFAVDAIVMTKDRSAQETPALIKASSGTAEIIPIYLVPNIMNIVKDLKDAGYWVMGLDGNTKENIYKLDMPSKLATILGSEQHGMQQLHKKHCDWLVKIPITHNIESLNASTAAAIAMSLFADRNLNLS